MGVSYHHTSKANITTASNFIVLNVCYTNMPPEDFYVNIFAYAMTCTDFIAQK